MCVPNLVPIGPETATCIRLERYTHRHTLSYIDIDTSLVFVFVGRSFPVEAGALFLALALFSFPFGLSEHEL